MGAMLPGPPPGAIGQFQEVGPAPQEPGNAVVRELRTSLLDIGTAVRLGFRGRRVYFGTTAPAPQKFTAPSQPNQPNSVRAGVAQAGVSPRMENKTASGGPRIASRLPSSGPILTRARRP
jgi:hypothetical protein